MFAAATPTAKGKPLFVVPTYSEAGNIQELVKRFFSQTSGVEMLVVDDASPDGTADVCRTLQASFPGLRLLVRRGPRGLGRAYVEGLKEGLASGAPLIGTMDADLSHDPAVIPRMLAEVERYDVVIGSRYVRDGGTVNWRLRRILLSWLANRFAGLLLGVAARDMTSGFRLYDAAALRRVDLDRVTSTGYSFLVETLHLLARTGARITEVPILFTDRTMGKSKLGGREIYVGAYHLLRMSLRRAASPKNEL